MTIKHEMSALMADTSGFALANADRANASTAQRGANQPLLPKAPQRPRHELGDLPLFGDSHKQIEMF